MDAYVRHQPKPQDNSQNQLRDVLRLIGNSLQYFRMLYPPPIPWLTSSHEHGEYYLLVILILDNRCSNRLL